MPEILSLIFVMYLMTIGFGLIVGGQRGFQRVNRIWRRIITGIIGGTLNLFGDALKALGKKVRR